MKARLVLSLLLASIAFSTQIPARAAPPGLPGPFLPLIMQEFSAPSAGWVTLFADGFETDTGAWTFQDRSNTDGGDYRPTKRLCNPRSGSYSVWMVGGGMDGLLLPCGAAYPNNAEAWMIYGPFSLADAKQAQANWRLWFNNADANDKFCYLGSKDDSMWSGYCLPVPTGTWSPISYELTDFLGESQVWLAFRFISDASDTVAAGAYVDDVVISKCIASTCPPLGSPAQPAPSSSVLIHQRLEP